MYNIKIAINTVKSFSHKTLPHIIASLLEAGIEPEDIYVFEGGHEARTVEQAPLFTWIKTNQNSFEYTCLIDIVENELEAQYWFLIHDTCKVGSRFKELVNNIPESYPDKVALRYMLSMSIGSYKYEYLLKHKQRIISIKNTDYSSEALQYWKQRGLDMEDYMLHDLQDSPCLIYNPHIYQRKNWVVLPNEFNWDPSATHRRIEYYANLDLYKSKSNWERKPVMRVEY